MNKKELKELYLQGKTESFLEALKGIEDNSSEVRLLKLLAKALKPKEAEREGLLQEAKELEREFSDSENLSYIGLIYLILGDIDTAKETLQRATTISPTSPYAYFRLGTLYLIVDDFDNAKELILKGLEVEEVAEAYHNLGFLYKSIDEKEKSKEAYLKGWELRPYRLGVAKKALESLEEDEIEALREELQERLQTPKDKKSQAELLARLAFLEYESGEIKDAIIKLNRAVVLDEESEELRDFYIHFMIREERYWILGSRLVEWIEKYNRVKEHMALVSVGLRQIS